MTKLNNIPVLKLNTSARDPTITGVMAPPIIPEQSIPEKDPWCSGTEFIPKEKTIDHITDAQKPMEMKE